MAVQKRQINKATGKGLIRKTTGKAVFAADGTPCGCGTAGASCANCDDPAPAKILAVFSGISPCITVGNCEAVDTNSHSFKITTFNVNGSYCLTQCGGSPGTCFWIGFFTGKFAATIYSDNACSTPQCSTGASATIAVQVNKISATLWAAYIDVVDPCTPSDPCNSANCGCFTPVGIFNGSSNVATAANDCAAESTITNGILVGDCFKNGALFHMMQTMGYGGSCTLTPFGC